jgi:hypothetical protein
MFVYNPINGTYFLFGGWGTDSQGSTNDRSDGWYLCIDKNVPIWTWIGGSSTYSNSNVDRSKRGIERASNWPGSRSGMAFDCIPTKAICYMFAGGGASGNSAWYLNEMWSFSFNTSRWTYWGGTPIAGQYAVYGTFGNYSGEAWP